MTQRVGALSLVHLARLKCIENAHLISDIGSTPYHLVEPVLKKKTAKSLLVIEQQSPQIAAYSEPLWQSLINRDFSNRPLDRIEVKNGKRRKVPARELYQLYQEEREEQRRQAAVTFKQITRSLNMKKNMHRVRTMENVMPAKRGIPRVPRGGPTGQPFKSSLLAKARSQNKMRCQYLSGLKRPTAAMAQRGGSPTRGGKSLIRPPPRPRSAPPQQMRAPSKPMRASIRRQTRTPAPRPNLSKPKSSDGLKHKRSRAYIYEKEV